MRQERGEADRRAIGGMRVFVLVREVWRTKKAEGLVRVSIDPDILTRRYAQYIRGYLCFGFL